MALSKQEIAAKLNADKELMERLSSVLEVEDDLLRHAHEDIGTKTMMTFTAESGRAYEEKITVLNRVLKSL